MALRAALAVPVEIRGPDRRIFRLSRAIGADGVRLLRPAPFELGRPVQVRFRLPFPVGAEPELTLRAEMALADDDGEGENGGRELAFRDPSSAAQRTIAAYVANRLGLPDLL